MSVVTANTLLTFEESQQLIVQDVGLTDAVRRVAALDFTMLKQKLMKDQGWTLEMCDEAEDLYRKFLALCIRFPDRKICPTGPIDEFWHAHILDTTAYAADCERLFGGLLHHYPYFGMRGARDRQDLEDTFKESIELFIFNFGVDPSAGDSEARSCRPQRCP